jgi:hypothetical protein
MKAHTYSYLLLGSSFEVTHDQVKDNALTDEAVNEVRVVARDEDGEIIDPEGLLISWLTGPTLVGYRDG